MLFGKYSNWTWANSRKSLSIGIGIEKAGVAGSWLKSDRRKRQNLRLAKNEIVDVYQFSNQKEYYLLQMWTSVRHWSKEILL